MSDIEIRVSLPLDDDGFFRRECPLCIHEFKLLPTKEDLEDLAQKHISSFLTQDDDSPEPESDIAAQSSEQEMTCPYCGQKAPLKSWWTQEQLTYMRVFAENIMAKMINEEFIAPLSRSFSGSSGLISMRFEGPAIQQKIPWISPETNDMGFFDLPCCGKKIKIDETWRGNTVHCIACGFPHKRTQSDR